MSGLAELREKLHRPIFNGSPIAQREQLMVLLLLLGCISTGMSVFNVVTHKKALLLATASFAGISFLAGIFAHIFKLSAKTLAAIFTVEVFILFTYFIVYGGTEGFSTIWLLLLPACGLFAFGKKVGTFLSGALLAELMFFFYTPWGRNLLVCTDYTQSFLIRFPVVYTAFGIIGYYLESVREDTYDMLKQSQQEYQYLSVHDPLTGIYNRGGLNSAMDRLIGSAAATQGIGLVIMDIDHFKIVNDTYGHPVGDTVLQNVAACITSGMQEEDAVVCRWGGEEFAVLLQGESAQKAPMLAEKLRQKIEETALEKPHNVHATASFGVACIQPGQTTTAVALVREADRNLYRAKEIGRNCVCCTE